METINDKIRQALEKAAIVADSVVIRKVRREIYVDIHYNLLNRVRSQQAKHLARKRSEGLSKLLCEAFKFYRYGVRVNAKPVKGAPSQVTYASFIINRKNLKQSLT